MSNTVKLLLDYLVGAQQAENENVCPIPDFEFENEVQPTPNDGQHHAGLVRFGIAALGQFLQLAAQLM